MAKHQNLRSIGQIAASSLSVRLYLEPIAPPTPGSDQLGVTVFQPPNAPADAQSQWYRVLGVDKWLDCDSTLFIVAALPPLTSDPKCGLLNTGYVEVPKRSVIPFVQMKWGDSLLEAKEECICEAAAYGLDVSASLDLDAKIDSGHLVVKPTVDLSVSWNGKTLIDKKIGLGTYTVGLDGVHVAWDYDVGLFHGKIELWYDTTTNQACGKVHGEGDVQIPFDGTKHFSFDASKCVTPG